MIRRFYKKRINGRASEGRASNEPTVERAVAKREVVERAKKHERLKKSKDEDGYGKESNSKDKSQKGQCECDCEDI